MTLRLPLLAAAVALAAWWIASRHLPEVLLPGPLAVAEAAWSGRDTLATATLETGAAAALGLSLASLLGVSGAVVFLRSRALEAALYPYALSLQTVPIVAVAPLLVVWLGYGRPVAVATAAIVSFFPVLTSANSGLRATSPEHLELFRLHGAGFAATLWKLRLPAALPHLFSGLSTAVGLSVIGAIVGEFVGSNGQPPSLGYLVLRSARAAETGTTFAAIFAATGLAIGAFALVRRAEHRMIGAWHP